MKRDFLIECRNYDQTVRGSWRAYKLGKDIRLGDEKNGQDIGECERLWLPAGTTMNWSNGPRSLRNPCLQLFWPQRWYTIAAFYRDRELIHTYANVIQPAKIFPDRLSYTHLDLSVLVKPDLSYEVLTQTEFEQAADLFQYSDEIRKNAKEALRSLTSIIQRSAGVFVAVPYRLDRTDFHLTHSNGQGSI